WKVTPLTCDAAPGRIIYSCKTGKNWWKTTLEEARDRSDWALEALLQGGYFVVLVHVPHSSATTSRKSSANRRASGGRLDESSKDKRTRPTDAKADESGATLIQKLAQAYGERMRKIRPSAEDPIDRIRILDANALRQFVCRRKPCELSP